MVSVSGVEDVEPWICKSLPLKINIRKARPPLQLEEFMVKTLLFSKNVTAGDTDKYQEPVCKNKRVSVCEENLGSL